MIARTMILAAAVALGGCSTLADFGPVSKSGPLTRKAVKNDQGHVVGFKQLLRNSDTGEVVAQVNLFTPIVENGAIVGYEEPSRGGAIIRDLAGHSIGGRFADLRSRSTNSNSKGGFTLIVRARGFDQALESENIASAKPPAPGFMDLLASLTSSDLNRIR